MPQHKQKHSLKHAVAKCKWWCQIQTEAPSPETPPFDPRSPNTQKQQGPVSIHCKIEAPLSQKSAQTTLGLASATAVGHRNWHHCRCQNHKRTHPQKHWTPLETCPKFESPACWQRRKWTRFEMVRHHTQFFLQKKGVPSSTKMEDHGWTCCQS